MSNGVQISITVQPGPLSVSRDTLRHFEQASQASGAPLEALFEDALRLHGERLREENEARKLEAQRQVEATLAAKNAEIADLLNRLVIVQEKAMQEELVMPALKDFGLLAPPLAQGSTIAERIEPLVDALIKARQCGATYEQLAEWLSSAHWKTSSTSLRKAIEFHEARRAQRKPVDDLEDLDTLFHGLDDDAEAPHQPDGVARAVELTEAS